MGLIEQVRLMHENGLHADIKCLASLLISLPEFRSADKSDFSMILKKYEILVYYGDAFYVDEEFRRAEHYYNEALRQRRILVKIKPKTTSLQAVDSEVELKFKIYQCHMKLREFRDAISILEGISLKQRSPKVNVALAKLYQKQGMERSAITCYKEVLRACPFALDAITNVLFLGVPLQEVLSLLNMPQSSAAGAIPEWISSFMKGQSFASLNKHTKAAQVFRNLETKVLRDSVSVLCCQAESCWRSGDKVNAVNCYKRIRALDPTCLQGMDIYSHILAEDFETSELETLAQDLTRVSQIKTEPWIAMAQYCTCTNRKTRAVYFAQKAHMIDTRNVQALLLKASLLQSLNKQNEALMHYREAIRLAPTYFEAYQGLVDCYLSFWQQREAMTIARNALKTIGTNARTLTLYAQVLKKDAQGTDKAKTMLEKALANNPSFLPAAYLLVEILMKARHFESAIVVLRKQLELQPTARLHQSLGDCLREKNLRAEALEHYNKALCLSQCPVKSLDDMKNTEIVLSKEAESAEINFSPQDSSYQNDVPDEIFDSDPLVDQDMPEWL
ncbi:anaphase-promoting complex subunit 7-like [Rhopilema esculentum]|uniref:anaphase-promoting complex subunit 7-like n=1 Tax=Rhopilema esculentum TaxID=499914 RepID=UPI0031DB8371